MKRTPDWVILQRQAKNEHQVKSGIQDVDNTTVLLGLASKEVEENN